MELPIQRPQVPRPPKLTHEEANRRVRLAMIPPIQPIQPDILGRMMQLGQSRMPSRRI